MRRFFDEQREAGVHWSESTKKRRQARRTSGFVRKEYQTRKLRDAPTAEEASLRRSGKRIPRESVIEVVEDEYVVRG